MIPEFLASGDFFTRPLNDDVATLCREILLRDIADR
jgi:hypothetical protein